MKTITISALCLAVLVATFGLTGCADTYGPVGYAGPGYYNAGYYGSNYYATDVYGRRIYDRGYYGTPYYNAGYGPNYYPGYAGMGYVSIAVGDRPYYTHGAGYWNGPRYYLWRGGHWHRYHGRRVWLHGTYVVRG